MRRCIIKAIEKWSAWLAKALLHHRVMKTIIPRLRYKHPFKERARQDPYRSSNKPKDHPQCPSCHSVSVKGRWLSPLQFSKIRANAEVSQELKCPACCQKDDQFALGVVEIRGQSWRRNQEELMNALRNTEAIARSRNDQERILWVRELKTVTKVYVALPELARQMGRVLENSFQGFTEFLHSSEEPYLRVRWWSDLTHMKHRPGHPLKPITGERRPESARMRSQKSKAFRSRSGG